MKKIILLSTVVGASLLALPAMAQVTRAGGISGSPHDFSARAWNTRKGTCTPCHQAHHTDDAQIAPLWSHAKSSAAFVPYSGPTMNAAVGLPTGVSLACLSCHDGTVAVNQGLNNLLGATAEFIDPSAQIGPNLHTTHPVSFTYDPGLAVADGGLEDPTVYKIGDPKTGMSVADAPVPATWPGTSLTGKTISQAMLFSGKMECGSCHDVHRTEGSSPTSGILARISGTDASGRGSLLCRTCHIK